MTRNHDFRAGEPEFSPKMAKPSRPRRHPKDSARVLLNIFLLEGEPAEKIIKRKILCVMFPRDMYRVVP